MGQTKNGPFVITQQVNEKANFTIKQLKKTNKQLCCSQERCVCVTLYNERKT